MSDYARVNGLNVYYEIHGAGEPLVLLHGGVVGIDMFGPNLPAAQLAILPGLTHYNIGSSPMLATIVTPFLEAPIDGL